MCGILAFFNPALTENKLKKGLDLMHHRGPDEEGIARLEGGMMGIRRLSIVDLERGSQPLFNEDRSLSIVCNGEIVNCRDLEKSLCQDHRFQSRSDVEVILHGYEEGGETFFTKLEGMFAFILYDQQKKKLLILRDPFGIKPLYYQTVPFFAASSEIKPLLALRPTTPRLNTDSLHRHLTFLYDPTEETCFRDIYKLKPGTLLSVAAEGQKIEQKTLPFWKRLQPHSLDPQEALEKTASLLQTAVQKHLLADVPVGSFLSGGLDSSFIAALAQGKNHNLQTFSIGFPNYGLYDETPYALKAASALGSVHHTFSFPLQFQSLPTMLYYLEEPVADASFLPFYLLCQNVAKRVKVALSGLGGDELFFGYTRYLPPLYPSLAWFSWLRFLLKPLPFESQSRAGNFLRLLKKLFPEKKYSSPVANYLAYNTYFQERERQLVYGERLKNVVGNDPLLDWAPPPLPASCRDKVGQWTDFFSYLPGDTLFLTDKISMASSLEVRVPFLFMPLVSFVLSLPVHYHFVPFRTKKMLKEIAEKVLPLDIVHRAKHGFAVPIDHWIGQEWLPLLKKAFAPKRVKELGLFSYEGIWQMIDQQLSKKIDYSQHLFQLLLFDLFHRIFMENGFSMARQTPLEDIYG